MQLDDSEHLKLHGSLDLQALPRQNRYLRLGFLLVAGGENDFSLGLLYKLEQTKRIVFVKMKTIQAIQQFSPLSDGLFLTNGLQLGLSK